MTEFSGFGDAGSVLAALPSFTREEYKANKPRIDAAVFGPAKAFVDEMVPALREVFGPTIGGAAKVNGSISPLNNDLRFAAQGTPLYRDYLLLWFWDGPEKKSAPKLAVRITADDVGLGIGMPFTPAQLERWRTAVDDDDTGPRLVEAIATAVEKHDAEVVGQALKRVPKPYAQDHPRGDLLRHKGIQVRWPEPTPEAIGSDRFVGWCVSRLADGLDLHRLLVEHVA